MRLTLILALILSLGACGADSSPDADLLDPAGEACEIDDTCESGLCVSEFADGTPVAGGMCTDACEWLEDDPTNSAGTMTMFPSSSSSSRIR